MHVSHLTLHDFRSYAERRGAARTGRHRVRRPQRPGQDQPRRGGRLPRPAVLAPGRRRRAAGARSAPTRRWSAPRSCATAGRRCSRSRSTPAGPTGPGSTGRRCPAPASCSAWCARCSSPRRTWRWSRATRPSGAASSTTCWCCGRPGWPACAPTTTGCSSSATPCSRPPGAARRGSSRNEGALAHALGVGRAPGPHRRRAARRAAAAGRRAAALRRQGLRDGGPRGVARRADDRPTSPPSSCGADVEPGRRDRRPRWPSALLAELERRRNDELDRGVTLVGPHRDDLVLSLGGRRCR